MSLVGIEEGIQAFGFPNFLDQTGTGLKLHLFTNNYTPVASSVLSNFTECADASYAAVALTPGSWSITNVSGVATASYPLQTFSFTSSATIYGYYVTDTSTTKVVWAERFGGAPLSFSSSLPLDLTLKVTMQ